MQLVSTILFMTFERYYAIGAQKKACVVSALETMTHALMP